MSRKPSSGTASAAAKSLPTKNEKLAEIAQMRVLAHDLSNALEAILQASYLLSHGKLETESKRWAHLIETSSEEAARINREMRKLMRSLGEE